MKSRSCVVHFDGIHLATAFFRSACHWRFGLKNYLLAAKRRCPAPGVPVGGCHERWARPGRPYYPPSACSKMPRSILLVFDLDGVLGVVLPFILPRYLAKVAVKGAISLNWICDFATRCRQGGAKGGPRPCALGQRWAARRSEQTAVVLSLAPYFSAPAGYGVRLAVRRSTRSSLCLPRMAMTRTEAPVLAVGEKRGRCRKRSRWSATPR